MNFQLKLLKQLQETSVSSDLKLRTLHPAPENMVKYNTSRFQVSSTRSVGGVLPYMGSLPIYGKTSHVCGTSPLWEHFPHMGRLPNYKKPSHTWEVFPRGRRGRGRRGRPRRWGRWGPPSTWGRWGRGQLHIRHIVSQIIQTITWYMHTWYMHAGWRAGKFAVRTTHMV